MKNTYSNKTELGTFTSDLKKNSQGVCYLELDGKFVSIFFKADKASAYQAELSYRNSIKA